MSRLLRLFQNRENRFQTSDLRDNQNGRLAQSAFHHQTSREHRQNQSDVYGYFQGFSL